MVLPKTEVLQGGSAKSSANSSVFFISYLLYYVFILVSNEKEYRLNAGNKLGNQNSPRGWTVLTLYMVWKLHAGAFKTAQNVEDVFVVHVFRTHPFTDVSTGIGVTAKQELRAVLEDRSNSI